jgi:hypothetical protein
MTFGSMTARCQQEKSENLPNSRVLRGYFLPLFSGAFSLDLLLCETDFPRGR